MSGDIMCAIGRLKGELQHHRVKLDAILEMMVSKDEAGGVSDNFFFGLSELLEDWAKRQEEIIFLHCTDVGESPMVAIEKASCALEKLGMRLPAYLHEEEINNAKNAVGVLEATIEKWDRNLHPTIQVLIEQLRLAIGDEVETAA